MSSAALRPVRVRARPVRSGWSRAGRTIVQDGRGRRRVASGAWTHATAAAMPESVFGAIPWGPTGTLVATSLAIMGTPGPATISLTAAGSAHGVRRSLAYLAGIVVGTIVVLVAVATGITAALLAVSGVRPVLLATATAYILWL